uniref:Putative secreted protein n=1 Tax=Ixodes ricinus TaxID=34613 RepID=A0A6B0UWT9_IXORI
MPQAAATAAAAAAAACCCCWAAWCRATCLFISSMESLAKGHSGQRCFSSPPSAMHVLAEVGHGLGGKGAEGAAVAGAGVRHAPGGRGVRGLVLHGSRHTRLTRARSRRAGHRHPAREGPAQRAGPHRGPPLTRSCHSATALPPKTVPRVAAPASAERDSSSS